MSGEDPVDSEKQQYPSRTLNTAEPYYFIQLPVSPLVEGHGLMDHTVLAVLILKVKNQDISCATRHAQAGSLAQPSGGRNLYQSLTR